MRFILPLLFLATPTLAHDYKAGDITVAHPMAFETVGRAGAGYVTFTNDGAPDRLLRVEADFAAVTLHATSVTDGVASMAPVDTVPLPQGTTALEPGGLHIMFMGLSEPWAEGDKIPATLIFENAGALEVTFNVEPRPEGGTHDHH